ncbi:MAG: GNAT family N-acetyltransferase [Chitinophagaceae bacterium]|nr:GNAT family N-acetyltransferase [Chitinophagaceae bacterium]
MQIHWIVKSFEELLPEELYQLLRLRSEVFVVEQNCVFLDLDNKDQQSIHLMGWINNNIAVYVRILPPGLAYDEPSIGRVVSSPAYRRTGAGRILMEKAIELTSDMYKGENIRIGAQYYLKNFYGSLGFEIQGDIYLEDGIDHIEMLKTC